MLTPYGFVCLGYSPLVHVKQQAVKLYTSWDIIQVSFQLHVPATLPPGQ
jgi:hypothetical protein